MGVDRSGRGLGRERRGTVRAGGLLLAAGVAVGVIAASSVSFAHQGDAPVITGDPVVGSTLTSSSPGAGGLYRWQRCDPSTATCADGSANDADWIDILGAAGHDAQTYTVSAADLGFLIRVLSKDTSLGTKFSASAAVGPVVAAAEPPTVQVAPQHGIQLIADLTGGSVRFKPPGQTGYSQLTSTTPIPVGSIVDARKGRISVTAATGAFGNTTPDQSFEYYKGVFKLLQPAAIDSFAIARLVGKAPCGSSASAGKSASDPRATTSRRRRGGRVWGSGRGKYGTAGSGGTGSVVGTTYVTVEKCGGTYFKVPRQPGVGHGILVHAKGVKKPIFLAPGESYFAEG